MSTKNHMAKPKPETDSPHCSPIGEICMLLDLNESLGTNIRDTLLNFLTGSQEGSRLTLQRNRVGFTAQVTGPVERTSRDGSTLQILQEVGDKLPKNRRTEAGSIVQED